MKRKRTSLIVHSRMLNDLKRSHFNNYCAIGLITVVYDDFNQPVDTVFTPYRDMEAIKCYKEPLSTEVAKPNQIVITDTLVVALAGYYPNIRQTDQCRINDTLYNITGVASDDTNTLTFLNVQIVNRPVEST